MRRTALTLVVLAAAAAPALALAQDRPPPMPTRDVAVTYRVIGGGDTGGGEMRIAWLTGEQRMRLDMPGGRGAMIMDLKGQRAFMVMDEQRMVMELPSSAGTMPQPGQIPSSARMTRGGTDRVAGQACTVWQVEEEGGRRSSARVTADGVLLRARGPDGREGIEATQVTYGPQDPARFRPPPGYRTEQMGMPPRR